MPGVEGVLCADGGLAHGVAKGIGKRVQRAPTGAVAGDDVRDTKRPQPVDGIRNDPFRDATEVQPAHHAVDRNVRKEFSGMQAHVDDAGMRARAEDDQSQIAHVCYQHAFVHEQRIGLPGPARRRSRQMVDATFLERCRPRYLAAQVEVAIDQQPASGSLTTYAPRSSRSAGRGTLATGMTMPLLSRMARSLNIPGLTCTATRPPSFMIASTACGSAAM